VSQSDFVSRGQALVAAGQFQEAVKVCRLGLLGRPTTVEGRVVLAQALLALKRYDEVLAEMRVALDLDQTAVAAHVLRAEALLRKGDTHPAIEALHKARQMAPGDLRVLQLLGEAESGAAAASVSHPAVSFVGAGDTKNYPGHPGGGGDGDESTGTEGFTRPTSLQSPGSARRSSQRAAAIGATEMTPPPDILAVGDRSGTVEVDPDLEGVEVSSDPDFDDLAAPPVAGKPAKIAGSRGSVRPAMGRGKPAKAAGEPGTVVGKKSKFVPVPTMSLEMDDDAVELADTYAPEYRSARPAKPARPPGPGTAVRNAVAMPSGVIGDFSSPDSRREPTTLPPPRPNSPSAPPPVSQQPMPLGGPSRATPLGGPPQPMPLGGPAPRAPIAAALPTVAAVQPPPPFVQNQAPYPPPPASLAAAQRPTMAVAATPEPAQPQFGTSVPVPQWAQSTVVPDPRSLAAAQESTARPEELDPHILALMSGTPEPPAQAPAPIAAMNHVVPPPHGPMKTGVRRARSRVQVVLWMLVGVVVIGGGVFAGFQIRAMRLDKQIAAARQHATDLAKADTWSGWKAARDSLASIVNASATLANRAALAHARALVAFELGEGLPEAKAALEALAGQGGLDGSLAVAYLALAEGDAKAAVAAGDTAVAGSDSHPSAQYVAAHAALLAGNTKVAVAAMKLAADQDPRPFHGVGLARAYAAAYEWEEAIAALDRVLAGHPDHPAASIVRGNVLAAGGRIFPGSALGNEVKQQLERTIAAGKRPASEQRQGVSPTQLAFAQLALARIEFARGDVAAARQAVRGATDVNLDDARFAAETIDVLHTIGELTLGRTAGELAVKQYPQSPYVRIALAHVLLAQGRPNEAIDALAKLELPDAFAVRGNAYLESGDLVSAAADFDAALKQAPTHEPAIVGRAWLEMTSGELDAATKRIGARMSAKGASIAVTAAYAATLRRSADLASRDKAKELLEKLVTGAPGPEMVRAQLELARVHRDNGDFNAARVSYDKASRNGNLEARFEQALVLIDYSKPQAGREILDALLVEAGERPSGALVLEAARARILVGAHAEAAELLARADKMSSAERWKLDRERGRLALRKSDFAGAADALGRALDTCGNDGETFLLAADAATMQATSALATKVRQLAPGRLQGLPEEHIVQGKLLVAMEKSAEADAAFRLAKAALTEDKASYRRRAQANFGLAVVEYFRQNMVAANVALEVVMQEDPTIVDAYIFAAEIANDKQKDKRKAYEHAQSAAQYNPDYAYAWLLVGKLAHELRDKRTLSDAIARLTIIAPSGDELKELQKLRR
jgi:tetratricopeptide (TPR) repeat protein